MLAAEPAPSIGVVICAYSDDRWDELVDAVESVRTQSRPAREIVVVIDHNGPLLERARAAFEVAGEGAARSSEGAARTSEGAARSSEGAARSSEGAARSPAGAARSSEGATAASRASGPVHVVASTGRPGLSGARNTGLRSLQADVVAFLDDDARADGDWLRLLAEAFADERVVGAGGWIAPRWQQGGRPRWFAPELDWIVGCSYVGLPPAGAEIRNPIGANMAFRRAALLELGGFAEGVGRVRDRPVGDEETQVGIEAHARWPSARIVHVPAARVEHAVPRARASWGYLVERCWAEGRSKAQLAGNVGTGSALASERGYAARVLSAGAMRGVKDALRGDIGGLGRAASIVLAFGVTASGYVTGRLLRGRLDRPAPT